MTFPAKDKQIIGKFASQTLIRPMVNVQHAGGIADPASIPGRRNRPCPSLPPFRRTEVIGIGQGTQLLKPGGSRHDPGIVRRAPDFPGDHGQPGLDFFQ